MIVTATRTQTELENAPGAVTVIDREMIEEAPARDLVDIIAETPGISLIGTGVGGRKTLSIRGADSRHTLILIDGRRIAASDAVMGHSNFENSWIPLEEIERIEVVRGPLSALYGSEALGGVINIITKVPTDTWSGQVKLGGGMPEGDGGENINSGAAINGAVIPGRVAASVSAGYIHERAIPDEDNPAISEIEGREIYSFSPKIYLTPTKNHRIELFASIVDEERDYITTSGSAKIDYTYVLDKYTAGISWSGTTGPLESQIDIYRSQVDKVSIKEYAATGVKSKTPDKATNDVVDAQTSMQLGFNLFTLGGEWREESIEADSLDDIGGEETVTYKSAFAQDEISLFNERLLLTPGLRYDHHEYFGSDGLSTTLRSGENDRPDQPQSGLRSCIQRTDRQTDLARLQCQYRPAQFYRQPGRQARNVRQLRGGVWNTSDPLLPPACFISITKSTTSSAMIWSVTTR